MNYKKEEADTLLQKLGIVLKPEDKDKDGKALLKVNFILKISFVCFVMYTYYEYTCHDDNFILLFLTPLPIYNERILASENCLIIVLTFSLLWNIFLSRTIFLGCYENVVACWRGSTSDDCHSPAISCNCSKISYGDAVRRTTWWWSCHWYQGLLYILNCFWIFQINIHMMTIYFTDLYRNVMKENWNTD